MFDIVLLEKEAGDGLTREEMNQLFALLDVKEAVPIEIEAKEHESSAMGFLSIHAAMSQDFDYRNLEGFIAEILDDMEKENQSRVYGVDGLSIYLTR